ncbi:MAG: hypothetical protein J6P03_05555, partial [Opitutales bacterium]|nr:hypothetical protein [Opitutales bacterium]
MEAKFDALLGKLREKDSGGGALPPATTSTRGGIIAGAGLTVALDGTLSAALPALTKQTITTSQTWTAPGDGVVFLVLVGGGGG